jgi:regulatory protein
VSAEDERAAALGLVEKKLRSMPGLDRDTATRRLVGMLSRKGYGSGTAYAVVRQALAEASGEAQR